MELETGRPSALTEHEIDQITASPLPGHLPPNNNHNNGATNSASSRPNNASNADHENNDPLLLFRHWISLSRIMGQISDHLFHSRHSTPAAASSTLLETTTRLDQRLQAWASSLPSSFSPRNSSPGDSPMHHFLAMQYHHTQISLFRAALLIPSLAPHCVAAARATAHLVLELADSNAASGGGGVLFAPTQPFLAGVVLGLHVLRNPGKRTIRSDLELLVGMTEYVEGLYKSVGQSREFVEGCVRLRNGVAEAVRGEASGTGAERRESTITMGSGGMTNNEENSRIGGSNGELQNGMVQEAAAMLFEPYEGLTLEELWSSISADFVMGEPLDFGQHVQ